MFWLCLRPRVSNVRCNNGGRKRRPNISAQWAFRSSPGGFPYCRPLAGRVYAHSSQHGRGPRELGEGGVHQFPRSGPAPVANDRHCPAEHLLVGAGPTLAKSIPFPRSGRPIHRTFRGATSSPPQGRQGGPAKTMHNQQPRNLQPCWQAVPQPKTHCGPSTPHKRRTSPLCICARERRSPAGKTAANPEIERQTPQTQSEETLSLRRPAPPATARHPVRASTDSRTPWPHLRPTQPAPRPLERAEPPCLARRPGL